MEKFELQQSPFIVPTTDGKLIEEHFGMASKNTGDYSLAHMVAPPGWGEPYQTPEFDELTYVISGRKMIETEGRQIVLEKNQSICIKKGTRVRYSNPYNEPVEYISVCIPAFTIERVKREDI